MDGSTSNEPDLLVGQPQQPAQSPSGAEVQTSSGQPSSTVAPLVLTTEPAPVRSLGVPKSPTTERKTVRRRKKLAIKDPGALNSTNPDSAHQASGEEDAPTGILLPPDIPFPITIEHLLVPDLASSKTPTASSWSRAKFSHQLRSDPNVIKTTPLFTYFRREVIKPPTPEIIPTTSHPATESLKGKNRAPELSQPTPTRYQEDPLKIPIEPDAIAQTYESPVKGELIQWCVTEGQVLREEDGWRTRPLVMIKEPCTHAVQWQGQCALCGSDLTIGDYTGISETSRASIPMSHGPSTLTVSVSEAQRLESETRDRLLKGKKLSLIVDLDQTIVHATVDPTVGEWMSDPKNPNWSALQNVGKFRLNDAPNMESDGCFYYLKQRPGLAEFLHTLADKYEMHVYTMGTRAYADAVCQIIDPTGEIFGNRILSRDESGSITQKSITRLFPVDTSMVVIIDDRGDVWEYSPNLVPVVPYNFFVGIGDINGAFLPPAHPLQPTPESSSSVTQEVKEPSEIPTTPNRTPTCSASESPLAGLDTTTTNAIKTVAPIIPPISPGEAEASSSNTLAFRRDNSISLTDTVARGGTASDVQSKLIADQLLARPLKQKQMELQKAQRVHKAGPSRRIGEGYSGRSNNDGSSVIRSSRDTTPFISMPCASSSSSSLTGTEIAITSNEILPEVDPISTHQSVGNATSFDREKTNQEEGLVKDCLESDGNSDSSLDDIEEYQESAVLVDQDQELDRLRAILEDVHTGFYSQDHIEWADVREVISALKQDVLRGVHLAFSSLWPIDAVPDQQEAWKLAEQFGANCYTQLNSRITHLLAAKLGTFKVNTALSRPNLAVVKPKWLYDAVALWSRPSEDDYSWQVTSTASTITLPTADSPQPEGEDETDGYGWGTNMDQFDWKDAADEVMAALDESDDETASGAELKIGSSDESRAFDQDVRGRKRVRTSITSIGSRSRESSHVQSPTDENLESDSPLSKRQRLARSRSSKLKLFVTDDGMEEGLPNGSTRSSDEHETDGDPPDGEDQDNQWADDDGLSLSAEEDEFLTALAAEMEGTMAAEANFRTSETCPNPKVS